VSVAPKLKWTRQDCSVYRNPKILRLLGHEHGADAYTAWSFGIAYSAENGLGGLIPYESLTFVRGTEEAVKLLEDEGFWEHCPQGWIVHDWDDYQPGASYEASAVSEDEAERRAKVSATKRRAALKRWHPELFEKGAEQ
jgi:hypothetical protein